VDLDGTVRVGDSAIEDRCVRTRFAMNSANRDPCIGCGDRHAYLFLEPSNERLGLSVAGVQ